MKDIKNIQAELLPIKQELETHRLKLLKQSKKGLMLLMIPLSFFAMGIIAMVLAFHYAPLWIIVMVLAAFAITRIYNKEYYNPIQRFKSEFKSLLLEKIVHELHPNMVYKPMGSIPQSSFYASHLFHGKANEGYTGEDYFEGMIKGNPIRFSEVTAKHLSGKNAAVMFSGLFMIVDLKIQFQGNTFILPDNYEKYLGQIAVKIQQGLARLRNTELLYLKDHPEFEEKFVIFCNHKEEAIEILNEKMLQSILWIRNQFDSAISIAFQDNNMYIAIPLGDRRLFDPDIKKSLIGNDDYLERIYSELDTCFKLIEQLPLDHLRSKF